MGANLCTANLSHAALEYAKPEEGRGVFDQFMPVRHKMLKMKGK